MQMWSMHKGPAQTAYKESVIALWNCVRIVMRLPKTLVRQQLLLYSTYTRPLYFPSRKMPTDPHDLKKGDEVSWKWGQGHPTGEVKDVVDDTAEVKTKRGNTVKKDGDEGNPAVVLNTGQSDAIKKASELDGVKASK